MYRKGQRVRIKATKEELIDSGINNYHEEINSLIGVIVNDGQSMPAIEFCVGNKPLCRYFIRNKFIFPVIENVE